MSQPDPQPMQVSIEIDGTSHSVPAGITLIQAMWRLGRSMIHRIGCLGGVCGACPVMVRLPNQMESKTFLACQTPVQAGMAITFLPSDQSIKAIAPLPTSAPDRQTLFRFYPETKRCTACRACSSVCPQGIDVMGGVRAAINASSVGDLSAAAEKFTSCVMCGLCATVCEVRIRPHRVGMYARRLTGAFYPKAPAQLLKRIDEIGSGKYEAEWSQMMQGGTLDVSEVSPEEQITV